MIIYYMYITSILITIREALLMIQHRIID